jgi:hypothetical protein
MLLYQASSVHGVSIESLVYFCTSVVWRASVADWLSSGHEYERISLGNRYQEEIRRYLLGDAEYPQNVVVVVILSQLDRPVLTFNFPRTDRFDFCRSHRVHIPGITFMVMIGKDARRVLGEICILRSQAHPIFIGDLGDRRAQSEILRLMGRVAPPGAEFPLAEGTERP